MGNKRYLNLILVVLLMAMPSPMANAFRYHQYYFNAWSTASAAFQSWRKVSSLLESIMSRVAAHRASRGDFTGAQRATTIAEGLHSSVRWWRIVGSAGWDYILNYAWRESFSRPSQYAQVFFHFNEILSAFDELMQARSETEKLQWISHNYKRVLRISKELLQKLLAIFSQSGPLRESIMAIQNEISDGELIRDCLQLGAADVKGLLQVFRDLIVRFLASPSSRQGSSHTEL